MTERRPTDAQLAAALRAYLPVSAPSGSADRLAVALAAASQERRLPFMLAPLADVDPIGRRRSLLVAAALLAVAAIAGAAIVGATRVRPTIPPDLSLEAPRDIQAFMVSIGEDSPVIRSMAITVQSDREFTDYGDTIEGPVKKRILMDAAGSVRIERYATPDATVPTTYSIITPKRWIEVTRQGDEAVWIEEARRDEPRSWVNRETSANVGTPEAGCDMARDETGRGWEYVGLEAVLGRPTRHVRCGGDLWIDVETRLVLRSRGPLTDAGQPMDATTRTIEVTDLKFTDHPAALFDQTRPAAMRAVTPEEQRAYEDRIAQAAACAADPVCSAPSVPLVTPPPAATQDVPTDLGALVARANAARDDLPPLQLAIERWRSNGGTVGTDRLYYERPDRYRIDWAADELAGTPARTSISDGEDDLWDTRVADDGRTSWLKFTNRRNIGDARWMWIEETVRRLPECGPPGGLEPGVAGPRWRHLGVDMIGRFVADHITCDDAEAEWTIDGEAYGCGCAGMEYWIDRATHLVVRWTSPADSNGMIEMREVIELQFVDPPDELFHPPGDAVIEVQPTPAPDGSDGMQTPTPQPAASGG